MKQEKIAGLIVAAGVSSRMNSFKPLMPLYGKPVLQNAIENLRAGGVEDILVVIGNRAQDVIPLLNKLDVHFAINEKYQTTDMLASAKLGLECLRESCDAVFFLPGDVPLFMPHSLKTMEKKLKQADVVCVKPRYCGQCGHPVLIREACFEHILCYDGNDSLRGALKNCPGKVEYVDLPDPGILLDVNTTEDYKNLYLYAQTKDIPSPEVCMEIFKWFNVEQKTIDHGLAVAQLAGELTQILMEAEYKLDYCLIAAGALLHDVAKGKPAHATTGGKWLCELGYPRVGQVISAHMDLPEEAIQALDESAIVYLADKLVRGKHRVSIEERFGNALYKWKDDEKAHEAVKRKMDIAQQLHKRIWDIVHKNK